MQKIVLICCIIIFPCCRFTAQTKNNEKEDTAINERAIPTAKSSNAYFTQKTLPKSLKEISGLITDGDAIWAISDNPKTAIYKLDTLGNVLQQLTIANYAATDVEAITADAAYLYIGDIGDNEGKRDERVVLKIKKASIGDGKKVTVKAEKIIFTFPDEGLVKKKKKNNFDAEAMLSYGDSLYVFTKRRDDDNTELMALSKSPGRQTARPIAVFNSKGLVTDAVINSDGSEIALIGYKEGHQKPFIWLLSNYNGNNFFSGSTKHYSLTSGKQDWQTEGLTYFTNNILIFSCEETKDYPASLFIIRNKDLSSLSKDN